MGPEFATAIITQCVLIMKLGHIEVAVLQAKIDTRPVFQVDYPVAVREGSEAVG